MTTLTGDLSGFLKALSLEQLETALSKLETDYHLFQYIEQDSDAGQTRLVRSPVQENWTSEIHLIWELLHTAIDWYRANGQTQLALFNLADAGRIIKQDIPITPMDKLLMEASV